MLLGDAAAHSHTLIHPGPGKLSSYSFRIQMDTKDFLINKREQIIQLAEMHGAYNVRVFGSVARGDAQKKSDIDFLVDMEPGRSLFDLGGLLVDLQKLLDMDVDVVTEKGLRKRIRDQVLDEAIPI